MQIPLSWKSTLENNNAFLFINGSEAEFSTTDEWGQPVEGPISISVGDLLEIIPDEGFQVNSAWFTDVWSQEYHFNIVGDNAELDIDTEIDDIGGLVVSVEQATPDVVGANRVYKVDGDIIKAVNDARFFYSSGSDGDPVSVDMGAFIIGLIRLPTIIDPELILNPEPIILGGKNTGVQAPVIATDSISYDMGTITVPSIYGDSRDYEGVVFNLHLPYSPSMVIDAEYIVDENVGIEYLIDVYTGEATINLSTTKLGGKVFLSQKVNLGVNVPFGSSTLTQASAENTNIGVVGDNRITTPFVERLESEAFLADSFFAASTLVEGTLGDETGYIVVDDSRVEVAAFANEKEEINAMLSRGVIIND